MARRRIIRVFSLLMFLVTCVLTTSTSGETQGSEDSYDIRISLFRTSDEVEHATIQPALRFTTITVPPGIGSIRELLLNSHIYADSDAIGLIYALNPDLNDPPQPGTKVRTIQIPLTPETTNALSDGFLFKI